jgi:hypothetical protein
MTIAAFPLAECRYFPGLLAQPVVAPPLLASLLRPHRRQHIGIRDRLRTMNYKSIRDGCSPVLVGDHQSASNRQQVRWLSI